MKAMILAAGRGERLRPLTDITPKPLIQAGQYRLIEYHLFNLKKAGFNDIIINVAWLGQQIIDTLGDGSAYGLHIQYRNENEHALETGGGIFNALDLLDEKFLVLNGDIWCDYPFERLCQKPFNGLAHLVLVNNPKHNPDGDFYYQDGRLKNQADKKLTFSGIGIYHADFFKGCSAQAFPLAPIIRQYIAENKISAEYYKGAWHDIGTLDRLQSCIKKQAL